MRRVTHMIHTYECVISRVVRSLPVARDEAFAHTNEAFAHTNECFPW